MAVQLDFFQEYSEVELLRMEMKQVKESTDKVRKSLFARLNMMAKEQVALKDELEKIKAQINKSEPLQLQIM